VTTVVLVPQNGRREVSEGRGRESQREESERWSCGCEEEKERRSKRSKISRRRWELGFEVLSIDPLASGDWSGALVE
jgi:hypothetical protein